MHLKFYPWLRLLGKAFRSPSCPLDLPHAQHCKTPVLLLSIAKQCNLSCCGILLIYFCCAILELESVGSWRDAAALNTHTHKSQVQRSPLGACTIVAQIFLFGGEKTRG